MSYKYVVYSIIFLRTFHSDTGASSRVVDSTMCTCKPGFRKLSVFYHY